MNWLYFIIGYLVLAFIHYKLLEKYQIDKMRWYDYLDVLNIFVWINLIGNAYVVRGAYGLEKEFKRRLRF